MAIQAEQDYDPITDTGKISIFPAGLAGTHGDVFDDQGNIIAPWSTPGVGEVWVDVGSAKSGTITEVGFAPELWQIVTI